MSQTIEIDECPIGFECIVTIRDERVRTEDGVILGRVRTKDGVLMMTRMGHGFVAIPNQEGRYTLRRVS